jgi:hypothetical protein
MASAFQTIVEIYVRGKNSKAIQESLAHRRKLTSDLKSISNGNHGALLSELAQEIALLEAGLKRLEEPAEEAARQNSDQASTERHSTPVTAKEAATADAAQQPPGAQLETPPGSKQVEILLVGISKSPTEQSPPVAAAQSPPDRPVQVQIVGLTIAAAASEANDQGANDQRANDQSAEQVDGNRPNGPSA